MMTPNGQSLLPSANRELRSFLARVDRLVHGTGDVHAEDLYAIRRLLESVAPELGGPPRGVSVDAMLQAHIQEYKDNLRAAQASLEQVRCVMLGRRARLEAAKRHLEGLRGFVHAYQTTM
jgi:hypothetical protein